MTADVMARLSTTSVVAVVQILAVSDSDARGLRHILPP
jgi:hypothetical protein